MKTKFAYDVGIIGAGVAGAFAAVKIAESHPDVKTILFDIGRPPGKRRRQLEGWLGCFPGSDGKLYPNDIKRLESITNKKKLNAAANWSYSLLNSVNEIKIIADNGPTSTVRSKIQSAGFDIELNDYIQWKPTNIHSLSKVLADRLDGSNVQFSFDNEVYQITKRKDGFEVITSEEEYFCKKIIMCTGRSGYRWANAAYKRFGLTVNDDVASYGIKIEASSTLFKGFNKSHCTIKSNDLEVGPFCWNGTVIPEDHSDVVLTSFRSNENRWHSDKVSFSMLISKQVIGNGANEAERLAKLCFLLSNDRVGKDKLKSIIKKENEICLINEFNWLEESIMKLEKFIPNLSSKGYFYIPDIKSISCSVILNENLETEVDGLYIAGESMGIKGILSAAITGVLCADSACK